jgi:hypothetical protein
MFYIQILKMFYFLEKNLKVVTTKGSIHWTHQAFVKLQEKGVKFEEIKDVNETQLFLRKIE